MCESKFCPVIVTDVIGGPLSGVTVATTGVGASYVNPPVATPHVPSEFTTTTFNVAGGFGGVFARIVPASTTLIDVAANPPK